MANVPLSICSHNLSGEITQLGMPPKEQSLTRLMQTGTDNLSIVPKNAIDPADFLKYSDLSTELHSRRVGIMMRMGAQIMGGYQWQQDRAELSGMLHDIGKQDAAIKGIIFNGRPLNSDERTVVNKHAQYGFEMLYNHKPTADSSIRHRLGNLFSHVALDVLFSHSHASNPEQRGVKPKYVNELVEQEVITGVDAAAHIREESAQLLAVADVTDALLSCGNERAYRQQRLRVEKCSTQINSITLPRLVSEIVNVPAIDVRKIVGQFYLNYVDIWEHAQAEAICSSAISQIE